MSNKNVGYRWRWIGLFDGIDILEVASLSLDESELETALLNNIGEGKWYFHDLWTLFELIIFYLMFCCR